MIEWLPLYSLFCPLPGLRKASLQSSVNWRVITSNWRVVTSVLPGFWSPLHQYTNQNHFNIIMKKQKKQFIRFAGKNTALQPEQLSEIKGGANQNYVVVNSDDDDKG